MSDHRPSKEKVSPAWLWDGFILRLQGLEHDAYQIGLYETAKKINQAVQAAGWERADQLTRASK